MRKVTKPKEGSKIPNTIHGRIKYAREKSGMTQQELADILGVTYNYVSMIESGKRKPDVYQIGEISGHLGVSCDFLLCQTHVLTCNLETVEISKQLGLSENAINALTSFVKITYSEPNIIERELVPAPTEASEIIESNGFKTLLFALRRMKGADPLEMEDESYKAQSIIIDALLETLLGKGDMWVYRKQVVMNLFESIITEIAPMPKGEEKPLINEYTKEHGDFRDFVIDIVNRALKGDVENGSD